MVYKLLHEWLRFRCFIGKNKNNKSSKKKHLLILAWLFPPTISGGVYRPLSFARYATTRGWKVSVLCFNDPASPTEAGRYLLEQLPSDVEVIRINKNLLPLSYEHFPRVDGGFANAIDSINLIINLDIRPSVLLASGPPFHNFIAGYYLSRYFKSPLILDYRDEWTLCPFDFVSTSRYDEYWEPRCLETAQAVIFTTDSQRTDAKNKFKGVNPEKFIVLPNGIELDDISTPSQPRADHITRNKDISFFGFLGSHTPPESFLDNAIIVFDRRPDLRQRININFIGGKSNDISKSLSSYASHENIKISDQVSKKAAIEMMQDCTALLLINPPSLSKYIPGKLFDYLASGTPILVYGEGGEAARIVTNLDSGIVIHEDSPNDLEAALDKLLEWPSSNCPIQTQNWIHEHSREKMANRLVDLLDEMENSTAKNVSHDF